MGDTASEQDPQSTGNVDVPGAQLAPILRAILQHNDQIVEQNQAILQLLNYHVQSLPEQSKSGRDGTSSDQTSRRLSSQQTATESQNAGQKIAKAPPSENDEHDFARERNIEGALPFDSMWTDVFSQHSGQIPHFARKYHHWKRPLTIRDAFLGRRSWCSGEYQKAYPKLFDFLSAREPKRRHHAQVAIEDFCQPRSAPVCSAYNELRSRQQLHHPASVPLGYRERPHKRICLAKAEDPFQIAQLWNALEGCACRRKRAETVAQSPGHETVCIRSINVTDISPRVLKCLLASTPPPDLSRTAEFMQRYLQASNLGKVAPFRYGASMSSFALEYHFSYYFVTNRSDATFLNIDARRLRKSAQFGAPNSSSPKVIHEESLSFLLIGHFRDVATCIQLTETYFKHDPYDVKYGKVCRSPLFSVVYPQAIPAETLLSWMSSALHHVSYRWQCAIDSIQSEIRLSQQNVFINDHDDLMADDPNFSLSKTYLWALQAYRLFEDTINETGIAWRDFKKASLPHLRDERMPTASWLAAVQGIDNVMSNLDRKVERIRSRIAEISELREALDSATTLFDSRISVRQSENIRLLTFVTAICLPVVLVASVFGMQFMSNDHVYIYAFAAALPAFLLAMAFVLFNMQNFMDVWSTSIAKFTKRLRSGMHGNHRQIWKHRANVLRQYEAVSEASSRRGKKESTAWIYVLFVIEFLCVSLPVNELAAALAFLRKVSAGEDDRGPEGAEHGVFHDATRRHGPTIEARIKRSQRERQKMLRKQRKEKVGAIYLGLEELLPKVPGAFKLCWIGLWGILRAFLIPFWIVIVLIEFDILLLHYALRAMFRTPSGERSRQHTSRDRKFARKRSPRQQAMDILGLHVFFAHRRAKKHPQETHSEAYRQREILSRQAPSRQTDASKASETKFKVANLDSQPLASRSPIQDRSLSGQQSPSTSPRKAESQNSSLPRFSFMADSGRNTIDSIEEMSRTRTSQASNARDTSTTSVSMSNRSVHDELSRRPPTRPPPHPPASPPLVSPTRPPIPRVAPASPSPVSDYHSRPGTAQTYKTHINDSFAPLPEMVIARAEPLRSVSATSVIQLSDGSARASREDLSRTPRGGASAGQSGPVPPTNAEQGSSLHVKGRETIRKSEYVDLLSLGKPPTPPPKGESVDGGSIR